MRADPYAPLARLLPVADVFQGLVFHRMRGAIVREFRRAGCKQVLDLCCGRGATVRRLRKNGFQAVGVDLSNTMLKGVRGRRMPAAMGDATNLPFATDGFDGAVVTIALHEMDPRTRSAAFDEMRRVVRPGGLVLVADFGVLPARPTLVGRIAHTMIQRDEKVVGKIHPPHWQNYQSFMQAGGAEGWLAAEGATPEAVFPHLGGALQLAVCRVEP